MTDRPDPATPAGATAAGTTPGPTAGKTSGTSTPPPGRGETTRDSFADSARRTASDATEAARGMAADQTERAKGAVADEVSSVAHALRTAADDLREGSAQERTFAQIADTLADAADAIRGKDLGEMVSEATQMARRNPMTFLGGAALLGFTAVRFARAGRGDTARRTARRSEPRPGPTTTPSVPASPEVAKARRMP
jgi:gas vesicle protein